MSKVPFSISLLSPFVLVTILSFPLELPHRINAIPLEVLWEEKSQVSG
jgi:hypothetical protein